MRPQYFFSNNLFKRQATGCRLPCRGIVIFLIPRNPPVFWRIGPRQLNFKRSITARRPTVYGRQQAEANVILLSNHLNSQAAERSPKSKKIALQATLISCHSMITMLHVTIHIVVKKRRIQMYCRSKLVVPSTTRKRGRRSWIGNLSTQQCSNKKIIMTKTRRKNELQP